MSTPVDAIKTPDAAPESPTTARPFEMDDDDVQEIGITGEQDPAQQQQKSTPTTPGATDATNPAAMTEDVPPPKPPRPVSEAQKNEQTLKEAFPSIDASVIRAVLTASGGRIEPAFNALLEMTDPDAAQRDRPPPPPPRPTVEPYGPTSTSMTQLEADELYARQLAEHYEHAGGAQGAGQGRPGGNRVPGMPRGRQQTGLKPNEMYDREHSFIDDDLPVIRENLRKGFVETQTKVNSFFSNLKKRIDQQFDDKDRDEEDEDLGYGNGNGTGSGAGGLGQGRNAFIGRPTRDQPARRSNDYDRYDADPELLSDDFAGMKFHNDGTPIQNRPLANPNLFKPPPPPKSTDGRRVAFNESVEDMDAYDASPKLPPKDVPSTGGIAASAGAGKASKWQPLSTVDPSPIAENDPFSLGDSDDEKDARHKEIKMEDNDRLKQAAAEAMADSLVDDKPKVGGQTAGKKD